MVFKEKKMNTWFITYVKTVSKYATRNPKIFFNMHELAWTCYKKLLHVLINDIYMYTHTNVHTILLTVLQRILLCCFFYCITVNLNLNLENLTFSEGSNFSKRIRTYMYLQCKNSFSPSSLLQLILVWQKLATTEKVLKSCIFYKQMSKSGIKDQVC